MTTESQEATLKVIEDARKLTAKEVPERRTVLHAKVGEPITRKPDGMRGKVYARGKECVSIQFDDGTFGFVRLAPIPINRKKK